MRMKTKMSNYGKYYETVFICADDVINFCGKVACELKTKYGMNNLVLDCDDFEKMDDNTKYQLESAYSIIFVLSDKSIEMIENTFKSNESQNQLPSFISMYKYINKVNSRAISCVIKKNRTIADDLEFPKFMGDFERLHRLELTLDNVTIDSENLAYNIRYFYSDKLKSDLDFLVSGNVVSRISDYYSNACQYSKIGLYTFSFLIVAFILIIYKVETGSYSKLLDYYFLAFFPFVFMLVQKIRITLAHGKIYEKNSLVKGVVFAFVGIAIYILLGLIAISDLKLGFYPIALTMVYLIWEASYFGSVFAEDKNWQDLIEPESMYLDFVIPLKEMKRDFLKKRCGLVFSISIILLIGSLIIQIVF